MNPGVNPDLPKRDLYIRRGTTFREPLVFKNADGTRKDISDWTFPCQARNEADEEALFSWTVTITDGPEGEAEIELSAEDSLEIDAAVTTKDYDWNYSPAEGELFPFQYGKVFISTNSSQVP